MSNYVNLSNSEIQAIYLKIKEYHGKFLSRFEVKLPSLKDKSGKFSKNSLVLCYLAQNYPKTKLVSKIELTHFIRKFYPDVADMQQA